jgi:hypothetical protein
LTGGHRLASVIDNNTSTTTRGLVVARRSTGQLHGSYIGCMR